MDYAVALEVLALASRDEYLKQALLRFMVQNFREDLRRTLGLAEIGLEWSEDFERFFREGKRRRRVATEEVLSKYRSYFRRYLEGRELTEELLKMKFY